MEPVRSFISFFFHMMQVFGSFLAIAFIVIMSYVLINMLIGVIVNSLHRTLEHEGAKQLCNQARVIDEIESLLPSFFERRHAEWHPLYVHVLRINPNKLDSIELDKLWSRHGEFAPVMLRRNDRDDDDEDKDKKKGQGNNKAGGGVIQNRSLENKLQEILDKINRLEERLTVEAGKEQI